MRKTIFAVAAMMALAGCTTAENDATLGGLAGAGIGALATGACGRRDHRRCGWRRVRRADRQSNADRLVPLSRPQRPHLRGSPPLRAAGGEAAVNPYGYSGSTPG